MNYKIILKFIILFNFILADPYEQLNIDFLKTQSNIPIETHAVHSKKKNKRK